MNPLVHWFRSRDPTVSLTFALAFFAAVQVFIQWRTELQRKRERKLDDDRAADLAFQLAWAEHFRIDGLADEWEREDLVSLSCLGVLNSSDILPRDWTTVMSALGRLSQESGYLGGVALTRAHDTSRRIAALNAISRDVISKYGEVASTVMMAGTVRGHYPEVVANLEKEIRVMSRDLSLLIYDAVVQSPRAKVVRRTNFRDDMRSTFGQNAVAALKERERAKGTAPTRAEPPSIPEKE